MGSLFSVFLHEKEIRKTIDFIVEELHTTNNNYLIVQSLTNKLLTYTAINNKLLASYEVVVNSTEVTLLDVIVILESLKDKINYLDQLIKHQNPEEDISLLLNTKFELLNEVNSLTETLYRQMLSISVDNSLFKE